MPVNKSVAPGNTPPADENASPTNQAAKTGGTEVSSTQTSGVTPPEVKAEGQLGRDQHAPSETGQGNTPFPADAREDQVDPSGYHDSLSGKAVDKDGRFLDEADGDQIPQHRIVADNWPDHKANTK